MIRTGLVSVTFRQLKAKAIIDLVRQAELDAIEWGGDIHVPHGEELTAHAVRQMTVDAGIHIPSYGSYYRAGHPDSVSFTAVMQSAIALGAPVIRVWAGTRGSAEADQDYWHQVVKDSIRIGDEAEEAGLIVAYEFHGNTLTDTYASTLRLLSSVDHYAVQTYWQPPNLSIEENVEGLQALLPWLANFHVISWRPLSSDVAEGETHKTERAPLASMAEAWRRYFEVLGDSEHDYYGLLEFVRGDTPEQFLEDAALLKAWAEPYRSEHPLSL
jgi:3-dehydroshikimate dehydratase